MAIKVACPNPDCKAEYQVPQDQLGKSASCLKCGLKFTLQMSADETAAPDGKAPASASGSATSPEKSPPPKPSGGSVGRPLPPAPRRAQRSGRGEGRSAGELPAKIGAYQIKRLLGAGAMGHVYLAHDPHLDRDVALKVLPRELTDDEERVSRFLREARLTAKVQHANTVVIHQVMVEEGLASIVMELVEGGSLDDIVEKGGPLPWREATRAIRDAAAGLGAAHEMGLVHRDIKPANLMRTGKGTVKVVDFGLVRAMQNASQLTQPGMILGTPSYMAPEQWMGQEADARSDLYSLVCTYYYLLTGKEPFAADSIPALGYQHRFEPFPDARQLVPELPVAVCRVLARGTQKEPAQRFQTAAELMAALDELLAMPAKEIPKAKEIEKIVAPEGAGRPPLPRDAVPSGTDGDRMGPTDGLLWLGFPAAVRGLDRLLRRLVGEENDILRCFLWAVLPLLLAAAVWAGVLALTPSQTPSHERELPAAATPLRLQAVAPQTVEAGKPLSVPIAVEDAAIWRGKLRYSLLNAPPGAEVDPQAGVFSWTPPPNQVAGRYDFTVFATVSDGGHAETNLTVIVTAPIALKLKPIEDQTVEVGKPLSLAVALENAEIWKGKVRYSLGSPTLLGMSIDAATGVFAWTPREDQAADEHKVAILATGPDGRRDEMSFVVKVIRSGPPPPKPIPSPEPAKAAPKEIAVDLGNGLKLEMVLIPAGEFMMGSPDSDNDTDSDEKPRHRVRITKPFYLGKYPVTQEQWEAVMGNNPSNFKGPKNPVEQVSWDDCQQFLEKLNAKTGTQSGNFVLPTEAQWEYACRARSTTRYCFGDDDSALSEYAWYSANSGNTTHPVGLKKPNAWGLYDMHGNVWEWCRDWYDGGYYARSPTDDPTGPATGSYRVNRGGSWLRDAWFCRSAFRIRIGPGFRDSYLGLRVSRIPAE